MLNPPLNGVTLDLSRANAFLGRVAPGDATLTTVVTLPTATKDCILFLSYTGTAAEAASIYALIGTAHAGQVLASTVLTEIKTRTHFPKGAADTIIKVVAGAAGGVALYAYLTD